jgi:hypothetical protein
MATMAWCLFAKIGTMVWCLFAKIETVVRCLFAIHKVSISITAGIASANTDIKVEKATNRRQAGVQSNLLVQPAWSGVASWL